MVVPIYTATSSDESSSYSTSSATISGVRLFNVTALVGVRWDLTVALIPWWLMTLSIFSCAQWPFIHLSWDVCSSLFWNMAICLLPLEWNEKYKGCYKHDSYSVVPVQFCSGLSSLLQPLWLGICWWRWRAIVRTWSKCSKKKSHGRGGESREEGEARSRLWLYNLWNGALVVGEVTLWVWVPPESFWPQYPNDSRLSIPQANDL